MRHPHRSLILSTFANNKRVSNMGDSSYGLLSPSSIQEKITLDGSKEARRFENGQNVIITVLGEEGKRERDSTLVHTKGLSEFKSDSHKPRLLTVHSSLIACHMVVESGDVIRIFNREKTRREFVRNISQPRDLQFALHAPLLASVDSECNLVVYKISENCEVEKFIEIAGWNPPEEGDPHISWCPYYPETVNDPEDCVHMLAMYKGKSVAVINVSIVHEEHGSEKVTFSEAEESKEAVFTVLLEDKITATCISPDSTALAVGTDTGMVAFYLINECNMTFAHNWNPRLTTAISHLHFLDMLSVEDRKDDARFWKHCIAAGDGGRRLALYECVNWKCLGSLRFDSELQTAAFKITVDPQLRYIHILDVDGMNLFCVELDFSSSTPKFSSLTQVTFCRPLYYLIPIEASDVESEEMFANEDTEEEENRVNVKYIALGTRSMVELQVNLEKFAAENHQDDGGKESEHSEQRDSVPTVLLHLPSTSGYHPQTATTSYTMDREELENRLNEFSTKLDNLSFQIERAECERKASTTNENLLLVLQQFKEEFSLREDRLMANVSDLIETSRTETLQAVRGALGESSRNMEALVQASHKHAIESVHVRLGERVREAVNAVVVPQVDRICGQMFKQLNDSFRTGLEQYMTQFRALHSATLAAVASATPAPSVVPSDRQALLQMIKSHQAPLAFDTVLNQDDPVALEFVCKNVDPDELFIKYRLSQNTILGMISQLSYRLESESDLRFRYLHALLEHLRVDDKHQNVLGVQSILAELLRYLAEFQNTAPSSSMKSQARLLTTIANMKHEQILTLLKPHLQM